jgi:hypothetical protein
VAIGLGLLAVGFLAVLAARRRASAR